MLDNIGEYYQYNLSQMWGTEISEDKWLYIQFGKAHNDDDFMFLWKLLNLYNTGKQ